MFKSRFLEVSKNDTGNVQDLNKVDQQYERKSGQTLLKKNSLSTWPSFLDSFTELR